MTEKRVLTPEEVAEYRQVYGGQRHLWLVSPRLILALCDTADALREALRPFADQGRRCTDSDDTTYLLVDTEAADLPKGTPTGLSAADLRRAAELVKGE